IALLKNVPARLGARSGIIGVGGRRGVCDLLFDVLLGVIARQRRALVVVERGRGVGGRGRAAPGAALPCGQRLVATTTEQTAYVQIPLRERDVDAVLVQRGLQRPQIGRL